MARFLSQLVGLLQFVVWASYTEGNSSSCRCLSTDSCWPSQTEFETLQTQLSQPLVTPEPLAAACYPAGSSSGNCTDVQQNWFNALWRAEHPGQTQFPNWEAFIFPNGTVDVCPKNATSGTSCSQGNVPVLGVDARTPQDVQAAVIFSVKHNLRVVVKNTGHDYLGRSTARGAFMIWTHNMKNIIYNDTFIPTGVSSNVSLDGNKLVRFMFSLPSFPLIAFFTVLTVGAGVQWYEAYDVVYAQGRDIVGGVTTTVSVGAAGGWIGGGGHSILSPKYGLGVDNVVQFTIVVSTGKHLSANAYQNSDLFWALRGGGGGTYGVVTSVSYRTYPAEPLVGGVFTAAIVSSTNSSAPSPILKTLFTEFVRITPSLSDGGWSGYSNLVTGLPGHIQALTFFFLNSRSWAEANETIDPFFDYARSIAANSSVESGGLLTIVNASTTFPRLFKVYETQFIRPGASQVGTNVEITSMLLPRMLLETSYETVAETLLTKVTNASYYLIAGGAVAKASTDSTGLNPAWRKALIHTVTGAGWADGAPLGEIEAAKERVQEYTRALEKLAPDSGAYFNEASLYFANPKETFFGSHYERLLAIKKTYDPHDLFIVNQGVGAAEWDANLNCRA